MRNHRDHRTILAACLLSLCGLVIESSSAEQPTIPTRNLADEKPARFDIHVNQLSSDGVPEIQPWKTDRKSVV